MSDLLAEADALYGLALADFTPTRDARAKELKGDDAALARQVKALRKPATAAWVVNQLVRGDVDQVAQVLAVGEALREAQRTMSAEELRELTRQRRQLTAAVTTRARALARERGLKVTEAVAEQVEATLTAAMVDETCAAAVRSGLLVAALAATGVGEVDVAAAVAAPEALGFSATPHAADDDPDGPAEGGTGRPGLRVVPDPDAEEKARAAAQGVLDEAQQAWEQAEEAHRDASSAVDDLEARSLQLQSEIEEARRRLGELESAAEEVDDELADAEDTRDEAAEALAGAAEERDAARAALDRLP